MPARQTSIVATAPDKSTRGEQMRERLLVAAAKVFSERGYVATRVSDINTAAQTSHGNFYWHFSNKDEILIEVLRPMLERMHKQADSRWKSKGWVSEDDYADSLVAQLLTYKRSRKLIRVMREAAIQGPRATFYRSWLGVRDRFIDRTEGWLTPLQQAGHLWPGVDPLEAAQAELAMSEQLAYMRIGLPQRAPSDDAVRHLTRQAALIWYRGVIKTDVAIARPDGVREDDT
ncbi:MAG: TetR family transcriptional regulator [Maritimibacter sp.]